LPNNVNNTILKTCGSVFLPVGLINCFLPILQQHKVKTMTWHSKTLYFFCFKHSVYGQSTCVFRVTVLTFSYKIQWHNTEFRLKHPGLQLPNALLTYCKLSRIMVPNGFYSQTYDAFENLSPGPEVSKWLEWHSLQFSEVPNFECSFFFLSRTRFLLLNSVFFKWLTSHLN